MNVSPKVLLVTPPFTQLNTPYPAMMYLKGFLNTKGVDSVQVDLSLEVILEIFSSWGCMSFFQQGGSPGNLFVGQRPTYFLLYKRNTSVRLMRSWLFARKETGRWLTRFANPISYPGQVVSNRRKIRNGPSGVMGLEDKARYLSTLYLEDLSDFLQETVDEHFGFSRYAEHLGRSASSFDELNASWQSL